VEKATTEGKAQANVLALRELRLGQQHRSQGVSALRGNGTMEQAIDNDWAMRSEALDLIKFVQEKVRQRPIKRIKHFSWEYVKGGEQWQK
jgi:hypothetical protein